LTDGQVSNRESVLDLCKKVHSGTRLFTVGLGSGVDTKLVEGIAAGGKGTCIFVRDGNDQIQGKILKQLKSCYGWLY